MVRPLRFPQKYAAPNPYGVFMSLLLVMTQKNVDRTDMEVYFAGSPTLCYLSSILTGLIPYVVKGCICSRIRFLDRWNWDAAIWPRRACAQYQRLNSIAGDKGSPVLPASNTGLCVDTVSVSISAHRECMTCKVHLNAEYAGGPTLLRQLHVVDHPR